VGIGITSPGFGGDRDYTSWPWWGLGLPLLAVVGVGITSPGFGGDRYYTSWPWWGVGITSPGCCGGSDYPSWL